VMILVGIAHKQYVFLWALLYVLIEYVMFIELGWPIAYKETLILVVILLILILKPEGLFSLGKRNI
jgi:branched-subunit amino acid ABC-type transport system permease component